MSEQIDYEANRASRTGGDAPNSRRISAVLGLVLTLAAMPAYMLTMDQALLRSSGLIAWVLVAAGLGFSIRSLRAGRLGVRIAAGVNFALAAFGVFAFFGIARLPASKMAQTGGLAPEFSLKSTDGTDVSLTELRKDGPVLLAFYRGEW